MFYRPLAVVFLGSVVWSVLFTLWLHWDAGAWSEVDTAGFTVVAAAPGATACVLLLFRVVLRGRERWHHWLTTLCATVVLPVALMAAVFVGVGLTSSMAGCNVYLGDSTMSGEHVEAWFCEQVFPTYSATVELYPAGRRQRRYLLGYAEQARMGRIAAAIDSMPDEAGRFRSRPRRIVPLGPGRVLIHFVDGTTREAALEP